MSKKQCKKLLLLSIGVVTALVTLSVLINISVYKAFKKDELYYEMKNRRGR